MSQLLLAPDVREITLVGGAIATVDSADFEITSSRGWSEYRAQNTSYAIATSGERLSMHQLILGVRDGKEIDHRDRNGLNNCRSNLRHATHAQNCQNRAKRCDSSSRFKGVSRGYKGQWNASISATVSGKQVRMHLGCFPDDVSAALAWDRAARDLHGEFARLNFPEAK